MAETTETTAETAVQDVADDGGTKEEAKVEAKKAVKLQSPTLSEEQLNKVADRVVGAFEERGAFDKDDPADDSETSDDVEDTEAEAHGEERIPPKRTFAQRYSGQGE